MNEDTHEYYLLAERLEKTVIKEVTDKAYEKIQKTIKDWFFEDQAENFKIWTEAKAVQLIRQVLDGDKGVLNILNPECIDNFVIKCVEMSENRVIEKLQKENEVLRRYLRR